MPATLTQPQSPSHSLRRNPDNIVLSERSVAIIEIVRANPGINSATLKRVFMQQYPSLSWMPSAASNLPGRLFNASPKPNTPAIWYTREQWAERCAQQSGHKAKPAPTEAAQPTQPTAATEPTEPDPLAWLAMPAKRTAPEPSTWVPPRHTPARADGLQAFTDFPSRRGDAFLPYGGIKAMCVGVGPTVFGVTRAK